MHTCSCDWAFWFLFLVSQERNAPPPPRSARVLQVLTVQLTGTSFTNPFSNEPPMVSLLVGDPWYGGARTQLDFPYQPRSELLREGDAVELLVLGRDEEFVQFKVRVRSGASEV